MEVVLWRFALALGVLGAIIEASATALLVSSSATIASVLSIIAYALFLVAIPYLATTVMDRWWTRTVATLATAWLLMVVLSIPADVIATWASASRSDTYFLVTGGWSDRLLFSAAGVAALAVLITVIGGLTRLALRSSAT